MTNFLKQFRENWLLLAFVGGVIIWYSNVNARLTQAEADIADLKLIVGEIYKIQTNIAVIQTDVQYIKQKIK